MSDQHRDPASRQLAQVTEAEEAAAIVAGGDAVLDAVRAWQASDAWRDDELGQRMAEAATAAQARLQALGTSGSTIPLRDAIRAVMPLLAHQSAQTGGPAAVVATRLEVLRYITMVRPGWANNSSAC